MIHALPRLERNLFRITRLDIHKLIRNRSGCLLPVLQICRIRDLELIRPDLFGGGEVMEICEESRVSIELPFLFIEYPADDFPLQFGLIPIPMIPIVGIFNGNNECLELALCPFILFRSVILRNPETC